MGVNTPARKSALVRGLVGVAVPVRGHGELLADLRGLGERWFLRGHRGHLGFTDLLEVGLHLLGQPNEVPVERRLRAAALGSSAGLVAVSGAVVPVSTPTWSAGRVWADRLGRSPRRGAARLSTVWNGSAARSRRVSGPASGANRARSVAETQAWSRTVVSMVPEAMYGETTTAGTRGPSRVKSNGAPLRCSSRCSSRAGRACSNPCGPTDPADPRRHDDHQTRAVAPPVTCPNLVPRHHGAAHDRRKPSSS